MSLHSENLESWRTPSVMHTKPEITVLPTLSKDGQPSEIKKATFYLNEVPPIAQVADTVTLPLLPELSAPPLEETSMQKTVFDAEKQFIIELRAKGVPNAEGAEILGLTLSQYQYRVKELIQESAVESRAHQPQNTEKRLEDALQNHAETKPNERANLSAIARELGVSKKRVQQLYTRIAARTIVPSTKSKGSRKAEIKQKPDYKEKTRTYNRRKRVLRRNEQGMDMKEIAKDMYLDPQTVWEDLMYWERKKHVEPTGRPNAEATQRVRQRRERLAAMLEHTHDRDTLLRELGVSQTTLRKDLVYLLSVEESHATSSEIQSFNEPIVIFADNQNEALAISGD